jgi:hypothetical protein
MSRLVLCGLLLVSVTEAGAAETWHRCRRADGSLAYQPTPCAAHEVAAGQLVLEPAPEPPAKVRETDRREIEAWARRSRERLAPSLGGRGAGAAPAARDAATRSRGDSASASACSAARAERDAAYARDSLRMDFDRRRALQDAVTAACGLR